MMSGSDMPGGMTATQTVEVTTTVTRTTDSAASEDSNMYQVWKFIYIDLSFVKSIYGLIIAGEIILSLLGLICVSVPQNEGCAYLHSGAYSYFEFTCSSCMIISMIWYALYALAVTKKLSFVRWDITEMIWCAFYIVNYLISSAVIASKACQQGGYKAAAAFGFFCLFLIIFHAFTEGRKLYEKMTSHQGSSTTYAPDGSQNTTAAEEAKY